MNKARLMGCNVMRRKEAATSKHIPLAMDPRLWRQLPEDLRERVLAFLPLKSLFRFRSVCRNWCSLVNSPQFQRTWGESNAALFCQNPWLIRIDNGPSHVNLSLVSCELASGKCFPDPEPCLFSVSTAQTAVAGVRKQVSVSGGLICYNLKMEVPILSPRHPRSSISSDDHSGIFVCNPVTRSRWQLPPLKVACSDISYQILYPRELGMAVDNRIGCSPVYRVLVIGTSNVINVETSPLTAVYDSESGTWSISDNWLPDMIKPIHCTKYSVGRLQYFCERGIFYNYRQFTYRDYSTRFEVSDIFNSISNCAVAAYDVRQKVWKRVVCPRGRHDRMYPVQSHNSSRLLVITHGDNTAESCKTVKLPLIPELLTRFASGKRGSTKLDSSKVVNATLYGPSLFQIWELDDHSDSRPKWELQMAIATEHKSQLWGGCWCPWTFFEHCFMPDDYTIWIFVTRNMRLECFQQGISLVLVCDLLNKSLSWLKLKMSKAQASEHYESPHNQVFLFGPRLDCQQV